MEAALAVVISRRDTEFRVDGAKARATIKPVNPHTMWPDVVRCITRKLAERRLMTFPGRPIEYKQTLKLK
mgnify:CR=1 FL=1